MFVSGNRFAALVALAAMLCPWAVSASLSHHLNDHHHPDEQVTSDVLASLHGHWHPSGTPDHDHEASNVPAAQSQATHASTIAVMAGGWENPPRIQEHQRELSGTPSSAGVQRLHLLCSLLL